MMKEDLGRQEDAVPRALGTTTSLRSLDRRELAGKGLRWLAAVLGLPAVAACRRAGRSKEDPIVIDSDTYLDVALRAERFIDSTRMPTEHGVAWPAVPAEWTEAPAVDLSLYHGTPGVLLFYLELHHLTGEPRYLETAVAGARDLAARVEGAVDIDPTLYGGLAGLAFCFREVAAASREELFSEIARNCVERLEATAVARGRGIGWIVEIPYAESFGLSGTTEVWDVSRGSAGTGLGLLYAHAHGLHPRALELAIAVGERLLEVARPEGTGLSWAMMETDPGWTAPNFAHGTAGIAYFLSRLHQVTGDQRFLDGALAGAEHLASIATVSGKSHLIYHHEEGKGQGLFYLSWCHGPAGTGRLFYQLSRASEDPKWQEWLAGGVDGILGTGAPEQRTPGFWNNVSQCCGDAGVGELALAVYGTTGAPSHLELAERVAAELLRRTSERGGGLCWVQAEHRVRPELLQAQTGYMQGAAGIGSYFLHLHEAKTERARRVVFPDSPFPA